MKSNLLILLEEIGNSITHGIAFLGVIAGIIFFLIFQHESLNVTKIVGLSVFGTSLFILYSISTLFHSLKYTKARQVFDILDHCAVYLLIAGTYTPLMLSVVRGTLGMLLLSLVWALAILGIIYQAVFKNKYVVLGTLFYIVMGWLIIIAIKPILHMMHGEAFLLLLMGGVSYTIGTIFFGLKKMPFNHAIWHLFVVFGSTCHFFAIYSL